MSHISYDELNQKLHQAKQDVIVGATYRHYKYPDRAYKVILLAILVTLLETPCSLRRLPGHCPPRGARLRPRPGLVARDRVLAW